MKLTFVNCDDWCGLYADGYLQEEGHSLDWPWVLKRLGIDIESEWAMKWMDDEGRGHMPELLSEISYFDE